jgi:hypothetical protein
MLILLYNPFLSIQLEKIMLIPSISANYYTPVDLVGYFPVRSILHDIDVKFAGGYPSN